MFKQKFLIILITIIYTAPLVLYLILSLYLEHRFKKLQTLDSAKRLKYVAYLSFYSILVFWILLVIRFVMTTITILMAEQFSAMRFFNFHYIFLVTFVLIFLWMLRNELKRYKWFRSYSPSKILAGSFLQRQTKLLKGQHFDQAKEYLVKVCELVPDNVEIWCRLGFYNELILKKQDDADSCMKKAKSILDSYKEPNNKEIACYEGYLGNILYNRGEKEEGLKHLKKSIELDSTPGRVKNYERKLAELKRQEKTIQD